MERVKCNLCGGARQRVILRSRDHLYPDAGYFNIVKCLDCGLVFVNPRPSPEEIGRFYPPGLGLRKQALRERKKESLYKRIPAILFGNPDMPNRLKSDPWFTSRRGRILDVGCGGGELLAEFKKAGWDTLGLEPFCEESPLAKGLGVEIIKVSFEEAKLAPAQFDIVIMTHVLEHLHEPLTALRKAADVLVPGGMIYVEVPNLDSLSFRVFRSRWAQVDAPRHLSHFTLRTMVKLSGFAGLKLVKVRAVAESNGLRETLMQLFVAAKYGGEFPATVINRILRTPAAKIATSLVSGLLSLVGKSDSTGYYLVREAKD